MSRYWTLDENRNAVPTDDIHEWGRFTDDREKVTVGRTEVDRYFVSTVFLGMNHRFIDPGPPLLFETMIFDHGKPPGDLDQWMDRYSTWDEAKAGHERVVTALTEGREP